ncbi:MAG: GldG family protein [Clostridia bacterium]|nr:GldG family protein [Clostridia bacterium]
MKKEAKKQENQEAVTNKKVQEIGTGIKKRWLINGTKTILLIAIIIAVYIGVNILLEKVVLPEIDCTKNKIYSLSQESKDKVGNIDKDINITVINYSNYPSVINFTERYVELNHHIKMEKIDDLSARADLMQKYSLNATDSLIIIQAGENEKTLTDSDLYTYDYTTYNQIDITEEAITNAIINVTTQQKPKIYFMSNHTMYSTQYFSTIMEAMRNEANEVETVDILANGGIPEDCDCLVVSTLKEDLTELEKDKMIEYIKKGGEMLLMCGPNISNANLSNFQKVLDEYGITIEKGVIFEGSNANMVSGYPDFIIEGTQGTSLTNKLNMTMNLCLVDAAKITFQEDKLEELGVKKEILATTTEKAFVRTNLNQTTPTKTSQDGEQETCTIAAIATKTIEEGKTSKLIIYANELFAMDMQVQINGYTMSTVNLYNNRDLILNSVAYLNEREDTMTIRKNYDAVKYTVTEQQNIIIMAIIFILPVIIIIVGIIIWQIRRRKK